MNFRDILTEKIKNAFVEAGYDDKNAYVSLSGRPDLCQYQCNACLPLAKIYKQKPMDIAAKIADVLSNDDAFESVVACPPGFLNIIVKDEFLTSFINKMAADDQFLFDKIQNPVKTIVDYGGANVAKSLHVGHLRSAIIGESIKRLLRFEGHEVLGDVHLGDWGLQMGIVILGIIEQFGIENLQTDEDRTKNITISVLEKTYPQKSAEAKQNEDVMAECKRITFELQKGEGIYFDIWQKVLAVSVEDLKKNYARLGVEFDLWKGESDTRNVVRGMIDALKEKGFAHEDDGALVIDITNEQDNPPLPPFILEKSDGAILYSTTDLATILQRCEEFDTQRMIYVVDNRQGTHFKQLFRTVAKTGIAGKELDLEFSGFGTMNGKDGKPYKTREGGVMRLEDLINALETEAYKKLEDTIGNDVSDEEKKEIAHQVGVGALKFADLSNHRSKDYNFDVERFCSFEGKTGPYVQYTAVRIASILAKCESLSAKIDLPEGDVQRDLFILLTEYQTAVKGAAFELAPNILVDYIYQLAVALNKYYHEYKVATETDIDKKNSRTNTLKLSFELMKTLLDIVGIEIPKRM
ncbi:MAG: arginine--tRNA ligase [Clostridia bacterium]|nr:arginine--tRNA ligase [Clostridia bacterium]